MVGTGPGAPSALQSSLFSLSLSAIDLSFTVKITIRLVLLFGVYSCTGFGWRIWLTAFSVTLGLGFHYRYAAVRFLFAFACFRSSSESYA